MYKEFGISEDIEKLSIEVEKEIREEFEKVDRVCEVNSLKVLKAMQDCKLSESHLNTSTGYGIDEPGRDKIEEILCVEEDKNLIILAIVELCKLNIRDFFDSISEFFKRKETTSKNRYYN